MEEKEEHQRPKDAKHNSGGTKHRRDGDCGPSPRCLVKREDDDHHDRTVQKLVPQLQQEQVHMVAQTLNKHAHETKQEQD